MKTFSYTHYIEYFDNKLAHIYRAQIESTDNDTELIKDTLETLMQIRFDNDHIKISLIEHPTKPNLYIGEYIEFERDFTLLLDAFAQQLSNYTGWDQEYCQLITQVNYTPIIQAFTRNRNSHLIFNSDDRIFLDANKGDLNEEHFEFPTLDLDHYIYIYID